MTDKITDFPAYARVEEFKQTLAEHSQKDDAPDISSLERRATFVADRILMADPELAPPHLMTNLGTNLAKANDSVIAYASNRNRQYLNQATDLLGQATHNANSLPIVDSVDQMEHNFSEVLLDAKNSASAMIEEIKTGTQEFTEKIQSLENQQKSLEEDIRSAKERSDQVVADCQKQFSESENRRNEQFEKSVETTKITTAQMVERVNAAAAADQEEAAQKSGEFLKLIQERDTETQNLAHAMGATGISTTFQAAANSNQRAADWLRILAIVLLLIMVSTVLTALWNVQTANLETTIIRFFAALFFGLPAAYLARESTRQRAEAVRSRRIESELTALGPFIEPLDDDVKAALRKELVETYFGRAFDKVQEGQEESVRIGGTLLDFVKSIKNNYK